MGCLAILGSGLDCHAPKSRVFRPLFQASVAMTGPKVTGVKNHRLTPASPLERATRSSDAIALRLIAATALAGSLSCVASAQPVLDPAWTARAQQAAQEAARTAFGGQVPVRVEVETGALDPRLQLAPCAKVDVFLPPGQKAWGRTRIGLKCMQGPVAWKVTLPMTVRLWAPALVSTTALPAGTVITAAHLKVAEVDWSERDSPVVAHEGLALGRTLGVTLAAGTALRQEHMRKRQWFDSGDTVQMTAVGPGFAIQAEGVAMGPGVEGQSVRIRTESGRTVTGTPVGLRRVEVTL